MAMVLSAILMLIVHAIGQLASSQVYNCSNNNGTTPVTVFTRQTSINSAPPSTPTPQLIMGSTIPRQNSDTAYAIGLYRGDVKPDDCRGCLKNSSSLLTQLCPNQKEAIVWYDQCMLRYSNSSILGIMETYPGYYIWDLENVSANYVAQFNDDLNILLNNLTNEAATGGSLRKYAAGSAIATDFKRLYALVQCTPDLSEQVCNNCLLVAIADVPQCCTGKAGGRVLLTSFNIRFDVYSFFNSTAAPLSTNTATSPPLTNTSTSEGNGSNTSRTVIIIVVASVAFVVLTVSICICICVYLRVRRPREKQEKVDDEIRSVESLQFDFSIIRVAIDDFSKANKLGQGGFGVVYKGMLYNGEEIAVKRLSANSGQGDPEFTNEVLLVAKLQHQNLVRLLGFCMERNERLLIYEFVPNTSLDHFLFDPIKRVHLNWEKCYKITVGTARGLLYLHEDSRLQIIYRDLKVSNILLDEEMNLKISDFGMAKLFLLDQTQANTSRIVGTYGYMTPEYAMHGQISVKSDVFSFGVLVLEIVSRQRNNCFRNGENVEDLLSYAWKNWREGTASHVIDPTLRHNPITEIMRFIHIGLLCIQESVTDRPTMAMIVLMLNSYSITVPVPSQPAFFKHKNIESDISKSDHSKGSYVQLSANEASITELYPH
ncbi:hypothetical protein ACB094_05G186100 [Castanea mollissima]